MCPLSLRHFLLLLLLILRLVKDVEGIFISCRRLRTDNRVAPSLTSLLRLGYTLLEWIHLIRSIALPFGVVYGTVVLVVKAEAEDAWSWRIVRLSDERRVL